MKKIPIGVFDSGYGGLTILAELLKKMPDYDYIYFGDNARAPYGNRSFDVVYAYTLEAVNFLFNQGCELVIIACNTASAKALRSIQQNDLPNYGTNKRVLGVIRPCTEYIGQVTKSNSIGILGTEGTVNSNSYPIELKKFFPSLTVAQHACPMWVPLIENNMHNTEAGRLIVKSDIEGFLSQNPTIDTLVLACTHYPVLLDYIKQLVGTKVQVVPQGEIVAEKLLDYLARHKALDASLTKGSSVDFYTSENSTFFDEAATNFIHRKIRSQQISI